MIKGYTKKVKNKAADIAIRTARQVGSELAEIPKQTVREVVGGQGSSVSPIVEAMQMKTKGEMSSNENIEPDRKRLDYLEKELEALRQKRDYQVQQQKLEAEKAVKQEEEPRLPMELPSKPKRGLPGFGKKKMKGTGEMIKSKK